MLENEMICDFPLQEKYHIKITVALNVVEI